MILNSPGTLQWHLAESDQHKYKPYAFGQRAPIPIQRNQVPPFQLVIPLSYGPVNSFKIVSRQTGTQTEKFSSMALVGLETRTFDEYKNVVWPAFALIPGTVFSEGVHYAIMSNGAQTWVSEEFTMVNYVGNFWKLEYCHGEQFPLPGLGHIDYVGGYKNYFYLDTEIGKPSYEFEEQVSKRLGVNFSLQQIRYKVHRFELILTEELLDAMTLIPLHDWVKISRGTKEYEIDEITFNDPDWQEQGDLAAVEVEFRTDTVVVVNGRGATAVDCSTEAGACYEVTHNAVAYIDEGTDEWIGEYYTTPGGQQIPFAEGDLVVVYRRTIPYANEVWLFEYSGGNFVAYPTNTGEYIYEANTGEYFYDEGESSLLYNHISQLVGTTLYGQALPNSIVEAYALLANGTELLIGVETSATFNEFGMTVEIPSGMVAVSIVVSNSACPGYYDSGWVYLEPFETLECQGDYASDEDATTGGVLAGEFYCLTIDNIYGLPAATVKRIPPFTGYETNTGAVAAVGYDVIWETATSNVFGEPSGMVRMVPNTTTIYDDDADAAAGGVAVGEFYVWNAIAAGFQTGLIKKRVT